MITQLLQQRQGTSAAMEFLQQQLQETPFTAGVFVFVGAPLSAGRGNSAKRVADAASDAGATHVKKNLRTDARGAVFQANICIGIALPATLGIRFSRLLGLKAKARQKFQSTPL